MKKRLFVSIPLSPGIREALTLYQEEHTFKGVRWVAPENLHVTVFFCGDVEETIIPDLKEALSEVTDAVDPFVLEWKGLVFGPPGREPRMIWGEFHENKSFSDFAHKIYKAVQPFLEQSIKSPRKTLIPHITMARMKDPRASGGVTLEQPAINALTVDQVHLMSSELTTEGSIYTVLSSYALT